MAAANFRPWGHAAGHLPRPLYGMPQRSRPNVPRGGMGMGQQQRMNAPSSGRMGGPQQRMGGQQPVQAQRNTAPNFKLSSSARNPPGAGAAQPAALGAGAENRGPGGTMGDGQDLTLQQLTSAEPHQQKQIIGEHLYRKIYNMYPQLAGKITGKYNSASDSPLNIFLAQACCWRWITASCCTCWRYQSH